MIRSRCVFADALGDFKEGERVRFLKKGFFSWVGDLGERAPQKENLPLGNKERAKEDMKRQSHLLCQSCRPGHLKDRKEKIRPGKGDRSPLRNHICPWGKKST